MGRNYPTPPGPDHRDDRRHRRGEYGSGAHSGHGWRGGGWRGEGWRGADRHGAGWHGAGWRGVGWQSAGWHGKGRHGWHPVGLAVVIALVQAVGTTLAARDQPATLDAVGYLLLVAGGLALAARVRFPVVTVAVIVAATVGYHALGYPRGPTFVALIIAAVAAVKAGHRYPVWGIAAAGYAALVVAAGLSLDQAVVVAAWVVGSLLAAELMRARGSHRAQLAQVRAERARVRAEQQRRQASEQRLRIAQELHDVLGHHLSLINVQAGVGLHLMDTRPEQARAALGAIKQASAEALREVRSVLAALHPVEDSAPRTPPPGLDRLDELITAAGAGVRTSITGRRRRLPADLDRAAYRIVQEALTNVRRHAGAGAVATVTIEYGEQELIVQVDDYGGAAATPEPDAELAEGGGISGMRERVAALGGSLAVGPRPVERSGMAGDAGEPAGDAGEAGGGFRVRARLPVPARDLPEET